MCKMANGVNLKKQFDMKDCAYVSQFYIETRYPADSPLLLSEDETKECLEIAENILASLINEI